MTTRETATEVLIVGAGPTGLALAAQLRESGVPFRIIDRLEDRARESRALGVQARTLELLQTLRLGEPLVARGSTSTRLVLHASSRPVAEASLGDIGATDTRFPFILFVSQVETEALLAEWARRAVIPTVLPPVLGSTRLRAKVFRFISELGIRYRHSPAVAEGEPRLRRGPRAGDRLPDARITLDGRATWLQEEIVGPRLVLLLCGDVDAWDANELGEIRERYRSIILTGTSRSAARGAGSGRSKDI